MSVQMVLTVQTYIAYIRNAFSGRNRVPNRATTRAVAGFVRYVRYVRFVRYVHMYIYTEIPPLHRPGYPLVSLP